MKKLLLDENVAIKIKGELIQLGYDVFHINDDKKGIPDEEVFKKALEEQRILITGDDDFKSSKFKYKTAIIWITPKSRFCEGIVEKIDWIIENIEKYNIDINKAFISVRSDKFHIEYRKKNGIFSKTAEKEIEFTKIKKKRKSKKNQPTSSFSMPNFDKLFNKIVL